MTALRGRGDEETFRAAVAWCASEEPLRRAFAADVLGRLGAREGPGPYAARAVPLLRELSRGAVDPEVAGAVVTALGHQGDPSALPEILRHAGHQDSGVRGRVALALTGLVPAPPQEVVAALIALSGDASAPVRSRAVLALAGADADTPEIRGALAARLDDLDAVTAAEAAGGLTLRQDPRALGALARILSDEEPGGPARQRAADAVRDLPEGPERRRLERTLPRRR